MGGEAQHRAEQRVVVLTVGLEHEDRVVGHVPIAAVAVERARVADAEIGGQSGLPGREHRADGLVDDELLVAVSDATPQTLEVGPGVGVGRGDDDVLARQPSEVGGLIADRPGDLVAHADRVDDREHHALVAIADRHRARVDRVVDAGHRAADEGRPEPAEVDRVLLVGRGVDVADVDANPKLGRLGIAVAVAITVAGCGVTIAVPRHVAVAVARGRVAIAVARGRVAIAVAARRGLGCLAGLRCAAFGLGIVGAAHEGHDQHRRQKQAREPEKRGIHPDIFVEDAAEVQRSGCAESSAAHSGGAAIRDRLGAWPPTQRLRQALAHRALLLRRLFAPLSDRLARSPAPRSRRWSSPLSPQPDPGSGAARRPVRVRGHDSRPAADQALSLGPRGSQCDRGRGWNPLGPLIRPGRLAILAGRGSCGEARRARAGSADARPSAGGSGCAATACGCSCASQSDTGAGRSGSGG